MKRSIPKFLWLVGFCHGFISLQAQGITTQQHTSLSSRYIQDVTVELKNPRMPLQSVVFGNKHYGYYEAVKFNKQGDKVTFPMIPPGYEHPIWIYGGLKVGKGRTKYVRLGTRKFRSPTPRAYASQAAKVESGEFSVPFFLVNGSLPRESLRNPDFVPKDPEYFLKDKYRYTFAMILNRLGEIVWLHVPSFDDNLFSSYISTKAISRGVYGLLFGKKSGYFEAVGAHGKVMRSFSSRDARTPFPMHHDFLVASKDVFYAVSSKPSRLNKWGQSNNAATFLADTLVKIDLKRGAFEEKFDFLDIYHPARDNFWTGDDPDDKKFVLWGEPKADFDFLHINAVDFVREKPNRGFLVSVRNISKVVLLDEKMDKVKWTFGSEKRDTFYIKNENDQFLHQHTPTLIDEDKIMLFDNGREDKSSRVVVYQLDAQKGSAEVVWDFSPKPTLFSKNRSSAYQLDNGNVLAYFVSPAVGGAARPQIPNADYVIEVDYETRREKARMVREFKTLSPGYRAEPLTTIGREKFLGFSLEETE